MNGLGTLVLSLALSPTQQLQEEAKQLIQDNILERCSNYTQTYIDGRKNILDSKPICRKNKRILFRYSKDWSIGLKYNEWQYRDKGIQIILEYEW